MIDVSGRDLNHLARKVANYWEKGAMAPIFYDSYLRKSAKLSQDEIDNFKPTTIKIPKPLNDLLKGDFEPAYEFQFAKPPVIDGIQFFTETSKKGVYVDAGYKNGDSRFPCDVQLSDKIVHGLLGGATGMGKSVFLDSVLYGILTRYPPWEVKLTLLDSKIVTFKPLATAGFPHIETVAATGDNDYLLSVLEAKVEEMNQMNQIFEKSMSSAQKIEDLRDATGLCFPRNIIIFDEFQACLSQASSKKSARITNMLDLFGRLGRSTGYHLLLSSQEIGGALPKGLVNQIKLRMALGCSASVSEAILGNDAARNLKTKGKMYINTEPTEPHNETFNMEYRVPFLEPNEMKPTLQKYIKKVSDNYEYTTDVNFYNETAVIYENKFPDFIRSLPRNKNKIYLGEPCRFIKDGERIVSIQLENNSMDNILVITPTDLGKERFVKMIKENLRLDQAASHTVLHCNEKLVKATNLSTLTKTVEAIRDTSADIYKATIDNIFYRALLVELDKKVSVQVDEDDESTKLYNFIVSKNIKFAGDTNKARCFHLMRILKQDSYRVAFGYKSASGKTLTEAIYRHSYFAINYAYIYGFKDKLIDAQSLPKKYVWILEMDKLSGIGRDVKTSIQDGLKKACQDGPLYNVHFILVTTTCAEMSFLKESSNYVILEKPRLRDINASGAGDSYPDEVSGVLRVLYDKNEDECYKFKKMFLNDELLVN